MRWSIRTTCCELTGQGVQWRAESNQSEEAHEHWWQRTKAREEISTAWLAREEKGGGAGKVSSHFSALNSPSKNARAKTFWFVWKTCVPRAKGDTITEISPLLSSPYLRFAFRSFCLNKEPFVSSSESGANSIVCFPIALARLLYRCFSLVVLSTYQSFSINPTLSAFRIGRLA